MKIGTKKIVFALFVVVFSLFVLYRAAFGAPILTRPDGRGDQLIFPYDARSGQGTIAAFRNEGTRELTVRVEFYNAGAGAPFVNDVTIPASANSYLATEPLVTSGMARGVGVALATAINGQGQKIVSRVLAGNYYSAYFGSRMAWGTNFAARSAAFASNNALPAPGTVIDGSSVVFAQIQPTELDLAAYFNPNFLDPKELTFISFNDRPGGISSAQTVWEVHVVKDNGESIPALQFSTSGVEVANVDDITGPENNQTKIIGGSMKFTANPFGGQNRLIYFVEALGTFGVGYQLPAVETSFSAEVASIFGRSCATSTSCHARGGAGPVNLEPQTAYAAICGTGGNCGPVSSVSGGGTYIRAYDPGGSYLLSRINGNASPRMPLNCDFQQTCLNENEQNIIRRWILAGAKNN